MVFNSLLRPVPQGLAFAMLKRTGKGGMAPFKGTGFVTGRTVNARRETEWSAPSYFDMAVYGLGPPFRGEPWCYPRLAVSRRCSLVMDSGSGCKPSVGTYSMVISCQTGPVLCPLLCCLAKRGRSKHGNRNKLVVDLRFPGVECTGPAVAADIVFSVALRSRPEQTFSWGTHNPRKLCADSLTWLAGRRVQGDGRSNGAPQRGCRRRAEGGGVRGINRLQITALQRLL